MKQVPERADLWAAATMAKVVAESLTHARDLQSTGQYGAYAELISATRMAIDLANRLHEWTEGDAL